MTLQDIYNQGQEASNYYKGQADTYSGQYNQYRQQTDQAQKDYQDYVHNMADPASLYSKYQGEAEQKYGFDPRVLAAANQNLTQSQNQLAQTANDAQAGVGGYGLTASQLASRYQSQAQPLQQVVGAQNNAVQNLTNMAGLTQTQANQQAQLGYQGEVLKSDQLNKVVQTAMGQAAQAQQNMQAYQQLFQQQGYITQQQAELYTKSQQDLAEARQAIAGAGALAAQAGLYSAQSHLAQQQYDQTQKMFDAGRQANAVQNVTQQASPSNAGGGGSIWNTIGRNFNNNVNSAKSFFGGIGNAIGKWV